MKKQTQKTKLFKKLKDIGFKKVPTTDGFVMYELTPSRLNQQKETA
jgi:arginine repressor